VKKINQAKAWSKWLQPTAIGKRETLPRHYDKMIKNVNIKDLEASFIRVVIPLSALLGSAIPLG
jgi:hypothetical protein